MSEESFLLVNLKEGKSKKLAQVISNETSRKILDLLTKKTYTETEIAKELQLPISTIHYNLQHLLDVGLIIAEEFHYSEKGKEVNHYKLTNKFIIIAPRVTESIKEKLKKILPIGMVALVAAGLIQLINSYFKLAVFSAGALEEQAKTTAGKAAEEAAEIAVRAVPTAADMVIIQPVWQNIALWFLFGAVFVVLLVFIFDLVKKK